MDHDTATLLNAFRSGDQEAFAILYVRHQALVRAVCSRSAAPGEVDDCLQAVFLVLSRRPAAAAAAPSLEAWLVRVAWHVGHRSRRDWRRRQQREADSAKPVVTEATPDSEALEHLEAGLERLPERQRQAVLLQYLGGQSPDAVATALGVTRNHAYQLTHRGLEGLRRFLGQRGFPVGATALTAWLAAPAQAHEVDVAGLMRLQQPTPLTAHLAQGAQRMLDLARLLPPVAAAAALIPVMAVGLWTAEAGSPTPVTVDLHVTDVPATTVIQQVATTLGTPVHLDPRIVPADLLHLTLALDHLPPREALAQVAKPLGLRLRQEAGGWTLDPAPADRSPTTTENAPAAPDPQVQEALAQIVSLKVTAMRQGEVLGFFQKFVGDVPVVVTPAAAASNEAPITITADNVSTEVLLHRICLLQGLTATIHGGRIVVDRPTPHAKPLAAPRSLTDVLAHPQGAGEQDMAQALRRPITVDFQNQTVDDVLEFLTRITEVSFVVDPALGSAKVTLLQQQQPVATLLTALAPQQGWTISVQHEAVVLAKLPTKTP